MLRLSRNVRSRGVRTGSAAALRSKASEDELRRQAGLGGGAIRSGRSEVLITAAKYAAKYSGKNLGRASSFLFASDAIAAKKFRTLRDRSTQIDVRQSKDKSPPRVLSWATTPLDSLPT